jgi:hypothetical protein
MSSIWTPGGERPVPPPSASPPSGQPPTPPAEPTEEDVERIREQLAKTPAAAIVANHCLGLWELAALHLSLDPPQLDQAAVAIDAMGAVVERLEGRLGEDEKTLRDALAQLRVAFVQIKSAHAEDDG